jgi:hypothetical protein
VEQSSGMDPGFPGTPGVMPAPTSCVHDTHATDEKPTPGDLAPECLGLSIIRMGCIILAVDAAI